MTVEGFCRTEQRDVPLDARGHCLADGTIAIPASYGDSRQRWVLGQWHPQVAKPTNYTYRPKVYASQVIAPPVSAPCQQCDLTVSYQPRGGDPPRYCSPKCKGAAARARRREARAAS